MNTFKLMTWLAKGDKEWSEVPAEEQMAYLQSLKQPMTDIQRSFAQYKCQNYFRPKIKVLFQEIVAAFVFPMALFYYLINCLKEQKFVSHVDAVGEFNGMPEIVPGSIDNEYTINNELWNKGASIVIKDIGMIISILFSHPLRPYFSLKCLSKIAIYSFFIRHYTPRAIIVHAEYTFTSSILTLYCERHEVKHINVMHGEKLIYIGWAFFRFSECYVWGEHYQKLLMDMGAEESQFKIEVPPALKIAVKENFKIDYYADYKYYLQIYSEEQLKSIINSLAFVEKMGKKVVYRPHPRFSDIALLEKYVGKEKIEYPKEVNIMISVSSCECVVGYCSTVLYQAYLCGKTVILDDITYKKGYEQLKNHRYVLSDTVIPTLYKISNEFKENN